MSDQLLSDSLHSLYQRVDSLERQLRPAVDGHEVRIKALEDKLDGQLTSISVMLHRLEEKLGVIGSAVGVEDEEGDSGGG